MMRIISLKLFVLASTLCAEHIQARFLGTRDVATDVINPSYGDVGNDTDFYEADSVPELCARGDVGTSCSTTGSKPSWYDRRGGIRAWFYLNDAEKKGFWDETTAVGTNLKATLDEYVGPRKSRLKEQSSNQDELFRNEYHKVPPEGYQVSALQIGNAAATMVFKRAGIKDIEIGSGFTLFKYLSKAEPDFPLFGTNGNEAVVALATNPQKAAIVSTWSYRRYDYNPPEKQAYSSTLTWNAWKTEAEAAGISPKVLKYQLRHSVSGILATNIMAIAHIFYPENVQIINDNSGKPLAVQGGQGRWTPDHPAYKTLLAIPNVRTTVNMLIDYNDEMDNPYIIAINTLPAVGCSGKREGINPGYCRQGEILIEFGSYSAVAEKKDTARPQPQPGALEQVETS